MKKVILFLSLLFNLPFSYAQEEAVRADVVSRAEAELGTLFFERLMAFDPTLSEGDEPSSLRVTWLDGGRAFADIQAIQKDLEEFQTVLKTITTEHRDVESLSQLPTHVRNFLEGKWFEIELAVEALPSTYHEIKADFRTHMDFMLQVPPHIVDRTVAENGHVTMKKISFIEYIESFQVSVTKLQAAYESYTQHHIVEFHSSDITSIGFASKSILIEIVIEAVEKYHLNETELLKFLDEFKDGTRGFASFRRLLQYKLAYSYHGINFYELTARHLKIAQNEVRGAMGYEMLTYRTHPINSISTSNRERLTISSKSRGNYLAFEARIARLKEVAAKIRY